MQPAAGVLTEATFGFLGIPLTSLAFLGISLTPAASPPTETEAVRARSTHPLPDEEAVI
jgi:hypothetical protein